MSARLRRCVFPSLVLAVLGAGGPLGAQSRDPVAVAKELIDARQPVATVAATLKRDHARTIAQTATILHDVGSNARSILPALRAEYTSSPSAVYSAMAAAGFPAASIADAFAFNNVALDCIDPQGFAIPCGSFGGTADQPTMGQLAWTPTAEGPTNGTLTISGTNIPPVTVKLGFAVLSLVSTNATAVVVRLPATTVTGDLRIIRNSDQVSGLLQKDFRVVESAVPWPAYALTASQGAVVDMKYWISGAQITTGCVVNGALATAGAGTFHSSTGFKGEVRARLVAMGAPAALATAWDDAFRTAFTAYTSLVTVPALPLYPVLAAFPGAKAPPVPNVPITLAMLASPGAAAMLPPALGAAVSSAISAVSKADPARSTAATTFATVVGASFSQLLVQGTVANLRGAGPVPKFAPPTVPVAPVEGGSCAGAKIVVLPPTMF